MANTKIRKAQIVGIDATQIADGSVSNTEFQYIGTLTSDAQTQLTGKVNLDQTVGQTIGTTGARLTKLWATDITVTNAIAGSVTGNAGTLTVADEAADTTCFIGFYTAASGSLAGKTNTNLTFNASTGVLTAGQTIVGSINGNAGTATALQNARTIGGVSFDGTANITVSTATGGFTVSGGNLALGANSLTMTGSLAATGSRVTKGWFTDIESTNMPTVGGTAILTSLTAPTFNTIELGTGQTDTTLSRSSAGVLAVEGVVVPTVSSTNTLTNKAITQRVVTTTDDSTAVIDVAVTDDYELSAIANNTTFSTTGSPTDGQKLTIRWKDAGVSKTLTWDAIFVAIGVALPSSTTPGKWQYVSCKYNSGAAKFHVLGFNTQA